MSNTRGKKRKAPVTSPTLEISEAPNKKPKTKPPLKIDIPPLEQVKKSKTKNKVIEEEPTSPLNPELAALFPSTDPIQPREFTSEDFDNLSINEHMRYLHNNKKVAHAVIVKDPSGEEMALQYEIPETRDGSAPEVRPLVNIEAIERFGLRRYRANTPEHNTQMFATRYVDAQLENEGEVLDLQIACFSPKKGAEPFWGSKTKELPLFRGDLPEDQLEDLKKELKEIKPKTKCGNELEIEPASVKARELIKTRKPDQNTVMGQSAKDAYEAFLDEMTEELHPEMKERLERAIKAPLKDMFYGNYRPEWLHGEGFSLTPISKDPQRQDNLGAAPKWANTEMMVLERIAKWFAINRPEARVVIKPFFEMLLDSELIKKINFEVTVEENDRTLRFPQTIDPFVKHHLFRKSSDLAQSTAIAYNILQGKEPINQQSVKNPITNKTVPTKEGEPMQSRAKETTPLHKKKKSNAATSSAMVTDDPFTKTKTTKNYPTHFSREKSLVQILTTFQEVDYDEPWHGSRIGSCSGSGLVVAHAGKKYILTNAHCVVDSILVKVRLANNRKSKYEAKKINVSYQCDLALLEVDDPDFLAEAQAVELGEMVSLGDGVQTIGFPMGGDEISITKGIVSRIEVNEYAMSDMSAQCMLQVQVDAPINPGNSGGPVFGEDGKTVVGVAFQGIDRGEGLGYIIPIPIVKHFLAETLTRKQYKGFPILPITIQTLENAYLRKYYGLEEDQSGIRINKIDYLSDAYAKLKTDDIILEIDGHTLSNEGTVDIEDIGNCIAFNHLTHMKFIGDKVNLKILRRNAVTQKAEVHNISVTLDNVPRQSEKIFTEHDKMPTYFIASGISFTPGTSNYLEGRGGDLEECFLVEEGCFLTEIPKKHPSDQIVIINEVLASKATEGYEDYVNSLVKDINGHPINNIRDVIKAIETNTGDEHCITTTSKKKIVVPNLSAEKHNALLKKFNIRQDRSDDLLAPAVSLSLNEPESPAPTPKSSRSLINLLTSPQKVASEPKKHKRLKQIVVESSEDEAVQETTVEEDLMSKYKNRLTPGQQKYLNKLNELEKRALEEDGEELDEDYAVDLADDESEEYESEEMSEEEATPVKRQRTNVSDRNRLFHNARSAAKEQDEYAQNKKRKVR